MSSISWYFEPSEMELKNFLPLSNFEFKLMSKLIHVIRLGLHLHGLQCGQEDLTITDTSPAAVAQQCRSFVKKARVSWVNCDKFFPLRLTAPSMALIISHVPLSTSVSTTSVFKICVLRTFGVGSEEAINDLGITFKESTESSSESEPDYDKIIAVISALGKGIKKITRPVYGQMQIARASVPTMLEKFWVFAGKVMEKVEPGGPTQSFEEVYNLLCSFNIPTVPKHGLLAWLITSDLTEWEICKPPTIKTLARHMGVSSDGGSSSKRGGPSGPSKALVLVEQIYKEMVAKDGAEYVQPDVGAGLVNVWKVLEHPPVDAIWLEELMEECRKAQGRSISVIDMEHLLCKIARYTAKSR
ncbi:uncharacterized protein LY89DRAFT_718435 [Mollisia scopiformis]|uniref:Uncharacterized protein n=1 Tax=Mollisia scopiformis TaxID=149040 RepID=A0A194XCD2_MOLSC|nr:uncharacterized protein LY89DRAFT_718435 [Mollisia scopiformis]KUJ17819.1 hypothetical protein LY89DRAFT_718435 [Mollisia scopiformis]